MAAAGRRVVVLGGTGFIGRNLVSYLVQQDGISKIRVVDKVPPQMAWLNPTHKEAFANPKVEFKHANLINPASAEAALLDEEGSCFEYVINLAAETKYGQSDPVYADGIVTLTKNVARAAAKHQVSMFIELSSGQMYSNDKRPAKEDTHPDPWTKLAHHKLLAEREVKSLADLPAIIVRPAIVYGMGDRHGLTPRLIIGAIYKYTNEKMKMLWTRDLKMNTVHVDDVCAAVWHLCLNGQPGQIYHLCDKGDTTQGRISELIAELFNIKFDFIGSVKSNMAKLHMTAVVEDINERHMTPWADACQRDNIANTPLNPFIDQELLYNKNINLDGTKVEETGFSYRHPELRMEDLQEILKTYVAMGLFPPCLNSGDVVYTRRPEEAKPLDDEEDDS